MKRLLVFISILICLTAVNAQVKCNQGDQKSPRQNDSVKVQVADASSTLKRSYDPNEIIGPEGYDSVRWVSINDVLRYTIMFENDSNFATAAAQRVDVRFGFADKAWMKGFGIGSYSFANMSYPVNNWPNAYQQRINLKDPLGYFVDVIGGLDVAKQQGFWTFETIDPATGFAPWQTDMGLLPINDEDHSGEGMVTFQLKPYEGLMTGDTISVQASIVFDQNDTIPTNRWCNKIDAGMPESKVKAQPHPSLANVFNLTFTGKDDIGGSGVRHLLLYLANHNGIYEEIDTVAIDTVLAFSTEPGKQYKLYSIAVDNTGNREPAKMEPDVILNFNQAPSDIILSNSVFSDDLEDGSYIGTLASIDSEDETKFIYSLAEGEGAIHNDLFQISGDQLQLKYALKCADDSIYNVRISSTDEGGMTFAKPFTLKMQYVLEHPKPDTLTVNLCDGDVFEFNGVIYDKSGTFYYRKGNDYMCDSVTVLQIHVLPQLEAPLVTVEGTSTLVSSAATGNQWYKDDGTPIEGATSQSFTPTEDGVYYVCTNNGKCESPPSLSYRVQVTDNLDLSWDLAKGWNWVSSSFMSPNMQNATTFLNPIASSVETFTDGNVVLSQENGALTGNLNSINPRLGYWIKVNEDLQHAWSGIACRPEDTPLAIRNGWNNIGYLPIGENPIEKALANVTPSENDVIKGFDEFAIFNNGKWHGTLSYMRPGEGYLYYSSQDFSFTYPVTRVYELEPQSSHQLRLSNALDNPWPVEAHAYQDNMTIVGRLLDDTGTEMPAGAYTIGAFVGSECRGVGQWIDDRLYLLIHGNDGFYDTVVFKALDNATGETILVTNTLTFGNSTYGNVIEPFDLYLNNFVNVDQVYGVDTNYSIYPIPVVDRLYINGDVDNVERVKILSINGKLMIDEPYHDGVDVYHLDAGTYLACIVTNHGIVYKKFIKK